MKNLAVNYGPWALVTGASSGIGEAFARRIAAEGVHLVIAARRLERLDELADELRSAHGIEVRPVQADLTDQDGIDAVAKAIADVELGLVVSNAGDAQPGAFLKSPVERHLDVVRLNVTTPVELTHIAGEQLVARGKGAVIITGSTVSYAGVAHLATYAATKAFVGTFAEGLDREWRKLGVDVQVVHPGPTRTEMVEMDGADFHSMPMNWMTPDQVASASLRNLGKKSVVVPGTINRFQKFLFTRVLPRRAANAVWSGLMTRMTDDDLRAA